MEGALYREISDYKDEIVRQMELTEKITNQTKGNKKTYLDAENGMLHMRTMLFYYNYIITIEITFGIE